MMDSVEALRDDLLLKTDKVSFKYLMELTHFQASSPRHRKTSGLRSLSFTVNACCSSLPLSRYLGKAGSSLGQSEGLLTGQA